MTKRRVVVTGMGMLTPVGLNLSDTWSNLLKGKSGVRRVDRFDTSDFKAQIAGTIVGYDSSLYFSSKKDVRKLDLFIQYGIASSVQAVEDSGLEVTEDNAARIGVAMGSGIGGLPKIEEAFNVYSASGPRRISPHFIPSVIINMLPGNLSIRYGMKGPNISVVTACTTGAHNIGLAARMISYGDADVMVAGGSEMATSVLGLGGFAAMRALSTRNDDPEAASRPWDRDRDGFVLSEGAGTVILEEYEHAKKRGAKIYAELAGFGMSADAFHATMPSTDGPVIAMQNAVKDAGLNLDDIDYINAHGTSTPVGDVNEANSIKIAFGDHAKKLLVSSTKSMTGHLLGASGAVEAIISILAMQNGIVPPTINLDNPGEDCDLNFVPHTAQEAKLNAVLSNSFGFGGTNGALVFIPFKE